MTLLKVVGKRKYLAAKERINMLNKTCIRELVDLLIAKKTTN